MKRYQLEVRAGLFFTQAALKQQEGVRVVSLLIDSGATYTIVSWATLVSLSLDQPVPSFENQLRLPTDLS